MWWIKLQAPGKRTEKSLGTSDRRQAEMLALPLISEHKAALLAAKLHLETKWRRQYEPGLHNGPNGERVAATERELAFMMRPASCWEQSRMAACPISLSAAR